MNVRLTIEEVFGDKTTIILLNVQDCTPENRDGVIRAMLAVAHDAFKPPLKPEDLG